MAAVAAETKVQDLPDGALVLILSCLDSPRDLSNAEAVCSAWRRVCCGSALWLRLAARHASGLSSNAVHLGLLLQKHVARAVFCRPDQASLFAEALAASSTDHVYEGASNTLSALTVNTHQHGNMWAQPCYWSSSGSHTPETRDWLLYRLCSRVCIVHAVQLQPYHADFQAPLHGDPTRPLYAPSRLRVQVNPMAALNADGWSDDVLIASDVVKEWAYTSDAFPVQPRNELQTFWLPKPVFCVGGMLRIVLEGRIEQQEADGEYYVCICRATALGQPLYGFRSAPAETEVLMYDGIPELDVHGLELDDGELDE